MFDFLRNLLGTPAKKTTPQKKKVAFPLYLSNTLTNKKEEFEPLKEHEVSMYNCGPTVYNYAHIGNMRAFLLADLTRRVFEYNGYKVNQVMNITDVGHLTDDGDQGKDKVEEEAKKERKTAKQITDFYTTAFFDDLKELNIESSKINFPRATDHIPEQIALIKKLEQKGYTYKTSDGVYFDTKKSKSYGKLGNINLAGLTEGARVEKNPEKRNPTDFALWKFSPKDEKREQEWQSPWGVGFPGWHIECSAMSMKYLGETFDIHTGGIDHIPVHHNNEIAQSESATGKQYARFWLHNAHVNITSGKMAKSEGNFLRLKNLIQNGIHPLAYRYSLLTAHYSSQVVFNFEALDGAARAYTRLIRIVSEFPHEGKVNTVWKEKFRLAVNDDLDTPKAISIVWDLIKDQTVPPGDKRATIEDFDKVLGLKLSDKNEDHSIPSLITELVQKREAARTNKDFAESDRLRDMILKEGFILEDSPTGPKLRKK